MEMTDEQVRALAEAAGFDIPPGEIGEVAVVFNITLKMVRRLQELDTSGLVPATIFPNEEG